MKTKFAFLVNVVALIIISIPGLFAAMALPYQEVSVGFDGPVVKKPALSVIESKDMLMEHWVSEKLGAERAKSLLESVDFNSQFIAVVQVGIRNTATGNINIAEIEYNEEKTNVVVYVRVGVNERDCSLPKRQSLPYAIGVIDKPIVWPTKVNYDIGNLGEGCQEAKGAEFNDI